MKKLFNFFITFIHPYSCILMIFFVVATLMLSTDESPNDFGKNH